MKKRHTETDKKAIVSLFAGRGNGGMISLGTNHRYFLYTEVTDMRKSKVKLYLPYDIQQYK